MSEAIGLPAAVIDRLQAAPVWGRMDAPGDKSPLPRRRRPLSPDVVTPSDVRAAPLAVLLAPEIWITG
jgi:hypothetical protein